MARFFAAAAVWGRLLLRDVPDPDCWNPERLAYWDETFLDGVSRLALTGEKIRSTAELDAALAASRRPPGIRQLWIHEDRLGDALLRWRAAPGTRPSAGSTTSGPPAPSTRWRAPAAVAAVAAAAFLAGYAMSPSGPAQQIPPSMNQDAARVFIATPQPVTAAATPPAAARGSGGVPLRVAAAAQAARPRGIARYAVQVGTFANPGDADRVRHRLLRKGYFVMVLRRGPWSQVVTLPYATRALAEGVVRGLKASGIAPATVTWTAQ